MRVPNSLSSGQVGFNMTPMIDIVFLLVIFFLLSSHWAKQEVHLSLPLPAAETGEKRLDESSPRITINVLTDGQLVMAGRNVVADELPRRFQQRVADEGENVEVVIRSDRTVPYGQVEPIMLSCIRAGIWNVTFAVIRPEDVEQ